MREIFFCDFSTHYMMGDSCSVVRLTPKQFEEMLELKKVAEDDDDAYDKMEELIENLEETNSAKLFGLSCTPYSELFGKMTPKRVIGILKQGKNVSGEWEEGSFAFATTKLKALDAVRKIEAKHIGDGW